MAAGEKEYWSKSSANKDSQRHTLRSKIGLLIALAPLILCAVTLFPPLTNFFSPLTCLNTHQVFFGIRGIPILPAKLAILRRCLMTVEWEMSSRLAISLGRSPSAKYFRMDCSIFVNRLDIELTMSRALTSARTTSLVAWLSQTSNKLSWSSPSSAGCTREELRLGESMLRPKAR